MSMKSIQRLIGGDQGARVKNDFYATPESAIRPLLYHEVFEGEIWEPACGDGAISKLLKEKGHNVYSSDLVNRGYGDAHFNFMTSMRETNNIITNPPFNIGTKFTLHALHCASDKVAIFNKLTFLEGKERKRSLYSLGFLKTVYVFSERQSLGRGTKGGMLAFAWFVFDKKYQGDPSIKFI